MENHLTGSVSLPPCARISLARDGVSSGRKATLRPPLSCIAAVSETPQVALLMQLAAIEQAHLEVVQLLCNFFTSFAHKQLLAFKKRRLKLLKTKDMRNMLKLVEQPLP
jgi:hypothetical protein